MEVRDVRTGARIRSFTAQRKPGDSPLRNLLAAVSPDRRRIATLTQNEASARLSLWDVETGKLLREQSLSSAILPPTLFSESFTFATRAGRSPSGDSPRSAVTDTGDVLALRVLDTSPGAAKPEPLRFWETKRNRIERDPPADAWVPEYREAVSPDGRLVATPGRPGDERLVRLRDARTGRDVRALEGDDKF
jgi:WD40 repeat protein